MGTVQANISQAVVTFRLEQYDPYAGRTGLVTVRLLGNRAIGFVTEGDWIEVQGKAESGFINAETALNHTSGAQFRAPKGCYRMSLGAVLIMALFIFGIAASVLLG
jgi:hypothetical protein